VTGSVLVAVGPLSLPLLVTCSKLVTFAPCGALISVVSDPPSGALSEASDHQVIEWVRAGQTELFELLVRRHNQRLYRVARAILGSEDGEAEDVTQASFVTAYARLGQFKGRAKFATWLTRIAIHAALARRRQRVRSKRLRSEKAHDLPSQAPTPEEQASAHEMIGVLRAAFDGMEEPYRVVFILRHIEGLSTAETAASLGTTAQTVKVRLHRARAKLRRSISARAGATWADVFPFQGLRCDRLTARVLKKLRALHRPLRGARLL
jgi:RNA polymerase sigma-70 factor, ECF subfamily